MNVLNPEWDDHNDREITKHHVTPHEVEDVCFGLHIAKRDPDSKGKGKDRYFLAGKTTGGKYLDVVIERLHDNYFRPVTAFEMSENYKLSYQKRVERR
jgi:uncharacterized DUF497 family protein